MAATPAASTLFLVLATTAVILLLSPVQTFAASPQNSTEFIRRSCNATHYPSLCYASLSSYASTVARNPTHIALAAANVTLASVQAVHSYVSTVGRALANRKADKGTTAALRDCAEALDAAADLTRQAAAELWKLPAAKGAEVGWRVSNAQTWMTAAMTYEDTCTDGFETVPPPAVASGAAASGRWSVKEDIKRRVELAERYTSNALVLVNSLVGAKQ